MDLLTFLTLVTVFAYSQAIKCHDCTSWNPYCREKVNEPFSEAVATVDCDKTKTCFLKKEESGVISRGCTDWWMETQVDINYEGCQTQTVKWLGKQTWCFCKSDHCNGASVEMLESGILPPPPPSAPEKAEKSNRIQDDGWNGWEFSQDWQQWQKTDDSSEEWKNWNEMVTVPWSEWEHDGTGHKPTEAPVKDTKPDQKFDDVNPDYILEEADHSKDPAWQLWWWHADSDRPKFNDFEKTWKAPTWVENNDGQGWDFPITAREEEVKTRPTTTERQWTWGKGWGHIFPWWSGKKITTTTMRPRLTSALWTEASTASPVVIQNEADNTLQEVVEKEEKNDVDITNDISNAEFFCWDCYSDSPLCGTRVDTQKAHYLGKTPCPSTNKCFVRKQGDVTYRGCADGWTSSVIKHDYVGCRTQMLWGKPVEWCFCTASLCNGDSMDDIKIKYLNPNPHPFKGNVSTTAGPDSTTGYDSDNTGSSDTIAELTTEDQTASDTMSSTSEDDITKVTDGSSKGETTEDKHSSPFLSLLGVKEQA
ncbi:uncharacterized protein LOC124147902 [Haliotis rufescens]|uniref:uncharacterized protein LOC124147902 n=1 Tax=Haliotis rufescens TaxID=6454 RepID=UPI001EB06A17|nr:uncharacterized protein LOC124147902 [Haliotis rufescens]